MGKRKKKTEGTGVLIARLPILHLTIQYAPGDELPTADMAMVKVWLESKAAVWGKKKAKGQQEKQPTDNGNDDPDQQGSSTTDEQSDGATDEQDDSNLDEQDDNPDVENKEGE